MIITHKINMDLERRKVMPVIDAVQDDQYSRDLAIALYSGDTVWIPPDGTTAIVRYCKPDGYGGEYNLLPDGSVAYSISENVVTVALAPQVLTATGTVRISVGLICGTAELNTFQILINVHPNAGAQIADSENYSKVDLYVPMPVSAEMGRYLCVAEVDENGIITATDTVDLEQRFESLEAELADLKYYTIEISSISNDVGTAEMGSTVDKVTISWELNKEPIHQTLNGEELEADVRTVALEGLRLKDSASFALSAADERGVVDSATTKVYFYNGVYYGVLEDGAVIDSGTILGLSRKLQSSKALSFTVDAAESQRIAYALPSRYGEPNFNVGGFDGGFYKAATLDFTNASGYTESYDVWLSDNTGLGNTAVKVS